MAMIFVTHDLGRGRRHRRRGGGHVRRPGGRAHGRRPTSSTAPTIPTAKRCSPPCPSWPRPGAPSKSSPARCRDPTSGARGAGSGPAATTSSTAAGRAPWLSNRWPDRRPRPLPPPAGPGPVRGRRSSPGGRRHRRRATGAPTAARQSRPCAMTFPGPHRPAPAGHRGGAGGRRRRPPGPRGSTVGLVGESGSGKSTLARLILRLVDPPDRDDRPRRPRPHPPGGSRAAAHRRRSMQIVFQDPYSSLDPRMRVNDIVGEPLEIHEGLRERPATAGWPSFSTRSAWAATPCTGGPTSSPAVSASASPSPGPWPPVRPCSCATNR